MFKRTKLDWMKIRFIESISAYDLRNLIELGVDLEEAARLGVRLSSEQIFQALLGHTRSIPGFERLVKGGEEHKLPQSVLDRYDGENVAERVYNNVPPGAEFTITELEFPEDMYDLSEGSILKIRPRDKLIDITFVKRLAKGSQSNVYLMECLEPFCSREAGGIVKKGTALVYKIYQPKEIDVSTSLTTLQKRLKSFRRAVGQLIDTCDESAPAINYDPLTIEDNVPDVHLQPEILGANDGSGAEAQREYSILCKLNEHFPGYFPIPISLLRAAPLRDDIRYRGVGGNVFEYIGHNLGNHLTLASRDTIDAERVVRRLFQSVQALQRMRIIHKDINLSNIVLDAAGLPKIIDFACYQPIRGKFQLGKDDVDSFLSRREGRLYPMNAYELFLGGRLFRPPETFSGMLTERNDVWSIGLVAYSAFTGEHLIQLLSYKVLDAGNVSKEDKRQYEEDMKGRCSKPDVLQRYIVERIMDSPSIPNEYKQPLLKCCTVNPDKRADMEEVLHDLSIPLPIYRESLGIWDHAHNDEVEDMDFEKSIEGMTGVESSCSLCRAYCDRDSVGLLIETGRVPQDYIYEGTSIEDAIGDSFPVGTLRKPGSKA